ncbi:MAG: DUF6751 family protein [Paraclostridium sp.]
MITNADITIYNSYVDIDTGLNKYQRTYIRGINFQTSNTVKNDRVRGLISDDTISAYIPFSADTQGRTYIKPKAFSRLEDNEKKNYFTFNATDKIVRGIIDFEMTGLSGENIAYLEKYYDDVYTITNITTNDNGSFDMQHWRVGAK